MAKTFSYRAKNLTGQLLSGTIVAENQGAVAAFIREKGYYVTNINEKKESKLSHELLKRLQRVKVKDLAIFCRLFSTLVGAGISFSNCLEILQQQTENIKLKAAISDVYKNVREGESLAASMRDHPGIFPAIMAGMIEAGETGGVLEQALSRLAILFEKEYKTMEKIKSAMTYPMVVLVMAVLAVGFILTFVLPSFLKLFAATKMELPLPSRLVIGLSSFLQNEWMLLLGLLIFFGFGTSMLYRKPAIKILADRMLLNLPVFGMLLRKVAIVRFAQTLGTLLRSGLSILLALDMAKKASTNFAMIEVLEKAQIHVRAGESLVAPLRASKIFTPMVVHMVTIGEEAGELDKMLDKIADFYESEVDDMVLRLSSLIEPILIGVLGVVIGGILLSVMLPMIESVTTVGRM
jgi:type IV pilus assembly protein PilC